MVDIPKKVPSTSPAIVFTMQIERKRLRRYHHDRVCTWCMDGKAKNKRQTTFDGGSLGSRIDEERSQLRYVVWIAEFSESLNLWMQMALLGSPRSMSVGVSDFIKHTRDVCGIEVYGVNLMIAVSLEGQQHWTRILYWNLSAKAKDIPIFLRPRVIRDRVRQSLLRETFLK